MRRRHHRKNSGNNIKGIFDHVFEERKALEYLRNCINSPIVNYAGYALFNYACDVFGSEKIVGNFGKINPGIVKEDLSLDYYAKNLNEVAPQGRVVTYLREEVVQMISKRLSSLYRAGKTEIEHRLDKLKTIFCLSDIAMEVLTICYFTSINGVIREYFTGSIYDLRNANSLRHHCHDPLGTKRSDISRVFLDSTLLTTSLLGKTLGNVEVLDWCIDYLSCFGDSELKHQFFNKDETPALAFTDLEVKKHEASVLDTLMRSGRPQNILLYGEPGTGKTSLARCLAKAHGRELLVARTSNIDNDEFRLRAITATINCADPERSLVLIDEADDVLNTGGTFNNRNDKSWINNLLDEHKKKVIWITNNTELISTSTMRRFSYAMEFRRFTEEQRFRVLKREIKDRGFNGYFGEEDLRGLCRTYSVSAGGIINAISLLEVDGKADKEGTLKKIRTVLQSHEKVTTGRQSTKTAKKDFGGYSLPGLNCSIAPGSIIGAIQGYLRQKNEGQQNISRPMSMLFYGMPGTGKSEFVYYLGHTLNKEVSLKRSSDIQSMWVGQTEKNIAEAFREGWEDGHILFFDEADSFLFPRQSAQRSWEISHTNEVLTQLENHEGIVIFATNDMPGLDHAALRRFRFKVEFRPLSPQGVIELYQTVLFPLVSDENKLRQVEIQRLQSMRNLTPGDFAVVRDQLLFMEKSNRTHGQLIDALGNEVSYKESAERSIGFNRCA